MADATAYPPPPGWHPDPWAPRGIRWWDGTAWTAHVAPAPSAVDDPATEVAAARRWCEHAADALAGWAAIVAVQSLALPFFLAPFFDEVSRNLDDPATDVRTPLATIPLYMISSALTAVFAILAIWTRNATRALVATGNPTTHTAEGAAAAWFVPVISLWHPYQAVRDLVPADHPARRLVGWWWACWLSTGIAALVAVAAAWFSLGAALLAGVVPMILAVAGGLLGRHLVAAVGEGFDELAGNLARSR